MHESYLRAIFILWRAGLDADIAALPMPHSACTCDHNHYDGTRCVASQMSLLLAAASASAYQLA
eukprot:6536165-Alexandrium_andersonii.AAC.1